MLSDPQIERYSRHVILPDIGGRGQERLLGSSVSIHGGGDAALLCASYLAGAGVGGLWLDRETLEGPAVSVLAPDGSLREALRRRNPDCRWQTKPAPAPNAVVVMGTAAPEPLPNTSAVFWGGAGADRLVCVRFPPGRACAACVEWMVREGGAVETPAALGTVLALLVLRSILGLDPGDGAWIWRLAGDRPDAAITPFPNRPGCRCDASGSAGGNPQSIGIGDEE